MPIFLKHIEGSKAGQLDTFDKDQVRIGRQRENDIAYDPQRETSVSGYHAEIYRDNHNYFIKDLQSRNGTYVNARKIDRPITLKDGDTIQFSSRGPKLSFSLRDPNAVIAAEEPPPPESAPTVVFSAPPKDQSASEKKVALWNRVRPYLPTIGAVGVFSALFGAGFFYFQLPWWKLLIGTAVFVLFAGATHLAWRWWSRRKSAAAAKQSEQQDREISIGKSDRGNILDLKKKWAEVLKSLRESKLQRSGDDPIYAFPWYLVIGEPASGKTSLIRACGPLSSVLTAGADGGTRNCDWWFFDKVVLLDTSGRYLAQTKESDVAGEWQTLLSLLRTNRTREPINGVIIALPADSLIAKPADKLKEIGAQLRERLDELVQRLAVKFPVYLMVTKSDRINGFNEFFQILPDQVKGQAIGYATADLAGANEVPRLVDRAFRVISERLEQLRLALLNDFDSGMPPHSLFLFPIELRNLRAKITAISDVVFRPSPYRDAPPLRGLFFTSSRHGGAPLSRLSEVLQTNYASTSPTSLSRDNFLRDFGSIILPTDRQLAGRTSTSRERYRLNRAAGVIVAAAASLLVCGVLTLSFTKNWFALSDLNISPCTSGLDVGTSGGAARLLRPLDDCRATVETLIPRSFWSKVSYNFGLGFAQKVGHRLQDIFLAEFRAKIANVIDSHIDKSLANDSENAMVVSLIVQRLDRLARCQENGRCDEMVNGDGRFNYQFMLGLIEPSREGDLSLERLQRTHESFLSWQTDPQVIKEIHAKDIERLRSWSRRGRLTVDWVLKSTKDQFPPIRAAELWGGSARGEVVGSYTARAWKEGISPLISGFQKLASEPEFIAALKKFHDEYRKNALREWDSFLTRFPDGESIIDVKGVSREFGTKILGADSPYYRAIDVANLNLSVVMGDSWQESNLPPWAIMLKRYVAVKAKPSTSGDTSKQAAAEKSPQSNDQAQKYFAMYLDGVSELRTDLGAADKAFKSAQRAFQEGDVSSKASHPLLRAAWALNVLKDSIGARQGEDSIFWILLERPLAVAWKAMLVETGSQLQEQWFKLRLGISKQLEQDPSSVAEKIYGFALEGPAAPFLVQGGRWESRKIFKQGVEFNEEFLRYLSQLRSSATGLRMTVLDDLPRDIVKPIYSQEKQ